VIWSIPFAMPIMLDYFVVYAFMICHFSVNEYSPVFFHEILVLLEIFRCGTNRRGKGEEEEEDIVVVFKYV
jgi:hypothetical protein